MSTVMTGWPRDAPGRSPDAVGRRLLIWTLLVLVTALLVLAASVTIGADAMWLVALGEAVLRAGHVPTGVPFAVAETGGWVNVPVLGEVLFALAHRAGSWGLPAAQLTVDAALLVLVAVGGRRLGAPDRATATVLGVVVAGLLPELGVLRAQTLSLVPFALVLILLRAEAHRPSLRVWWLVPVVALWANLHGAVLIGVAVAGCYLLVARARTQPWLAAAVVTTTVAAPLLTPAGLRTPAYYAGVLSNEAARRGAHLWATLDPTSPFGALLLTAAVILVVLAVLARRPLWEYVTLAGLVLATAFAARNGVWLVLFAAAPAAAGLARILPRRPPPRPRIAVIGAVAALAVVCGAVSRLQARTPEFAADGDVARTITRLAAGHTVLAPEPLAESLAAAGARVWLGNPIDAFSRADQAAYLDFLAGGGPHATRALAAADLVVVEPDSPSAALAREHGFTPLTRVGAFVVEAPLTPRRP